MAEHTPTPWCTREDSSNCIAICFDPQHPNAEGDEIASVYREGIQTNDEMRADAALIIKAVNSHEALVEALEFIRDGYDNHDVNHVDYRVKVYQVALDALSLVNGDVGQVGSSGK